MNPIEAISVLQTRIQNPESDTYGGMCEAEYRQEAVELAIKALEEKVEREKLKTVKVGDTVWALIHKLYKNPIKGDEAGKLLKCEVGTITINSKGTYMTLIPIYPSIMSRHDNMRYSIAEIGKNVFISQEEAERRFKCQQAQEVNL